MTATTAAVAPAAPTLLAVMGASRSSVTLAWQPPAADGGAPVTGYQVELQAVTRAAVEVLGRDWLAVYDGPSLAATASMLQPGCTYLARTCARNAAGVGVFTPALRFTTAADAPLPPRLSECNVEAMVRGAGGRRRRGAAELPASGQRLRRRQARPSIWQAATPLPAAAWGRAHCRLRGNRRATGARSLSPRTTPHRPLLTHPLTPHLHTRLAQSALLKWEAPPHDGGAPVTGYRVEMRCSPTQPEGRAGGEGLAQDQSLALAPHFLTIYRLAAGRGEGGGQRGRGARAGAACHAQEAARPALAAGWGGSGIAARLQARLRRLRPRSGAAWTQPRASRSPTTSTRPPNTHPPQRPGAVCTGDRPRARDHV